MKKILFLLLLILNGYCFAQSPADEVRKIIIQQENDWNKNDMNAYTSSFTDDAKLINFLGLFWKGKREIINQFKLINDCCIKPTQVKLDITDMQLLNEEVALVYIRETLTAKEDYSVPGKIIKKGSIDHKLITAVFVKQKSGWKILSMQVTQVIPLQ